MPNNDVEPTLEILRMSVLYDQNMPKNDVEPTLEILRMSVLYDKNMLNNDVEPTLEILRMRTHVMTFASGFYIIIWHVLGHITHSVILQYAVHE